MPHRIQKLTLCLSLIGTMPLIFQMEERKIVFVGQIFRLAADHLSSSLLCYRLASNYGLFAHDRHQKGVIPSISHYSLTYLMFNRMQSGHFATKYSLDKVGLSGWT